LGPKVIVQTVDKVKIIREYLKTAQSRQKSWADIGRRLLKFRAGEHVS